MNHEKIKNALNISLLMICVIFLSLIFLDYVLPLILPFLISYATAYLADKPARYLEKKGKMKRRGVRLVISLLSLILLFSMLFLLIRESGLLLLELTGELIEGDKISETIRSIMKPLEAAFGNIIPPELANEVSAALKALLSFALSALGKLITSFASFLPKLFLFILITIISLVYFSVDLEAINSKVSKFLPEKARVFLLDIRSRFLSVGVKYIKSYAIIMGVTFSILTLGFLILRVDRQIILSVLIASLDLLPVIGVGTVLVPWGVIELILGNTRRGVGLIILFVFNEVVRQYSEPKILGKSLNMHPIITLIMVYASFSLFGIKGLVLIPLFVVCINIFSESRAES